METKVCTKCKLVYLNNSDFFPVYSNKNKTKTYLRSWCKKCKKNYDIEYKKLNLDRALLLAKLNRYNLSIDEYNNLFKKQGGRCYICREFETKKLRGKIKSLSIDHDHKCCPGYKSCGKCIRGLLCYNCNALLAMARDDYFILFEAINYLMNYQLKEDIKISKYNKESVGIINNLIDEKFINIIKKCKDFNKIIG